MTRSSRRPRLSIAFFLTAVMRGHSALKTRVNALVTRASHPFAAVLIRHRHGAQRQALARGELLGGALELAAGGEDVASARRAHRRGIAGIEDDLGEFL